MISKKQQEAINLATKYPITLINGYAGTGKSFVIEEISKVLRKEGWKICKTSPTGKASKRIGGITIHSWLEPQVEELPNGEIKIVGYKKNKFKKKECLIVDESSMMDQEIFDRITKIWRNTTKKEKKVIFVGDTKQLEPVGDGSPFIDMIENNKYPNTELTKIFRTDNDINEFAAKIRVGDAGILDFKGYENILNKSLKVIISMFLKDYQNFQFICPFNKYENGTNALNKKLQKHVIVDKDFTKKAFKNKIWKQENERWKKIDDIQFYIGDKVLFTKNILSTEIRNGSVAILTKVGTKKRKKVATFLDVDTNNIFSIEIKKIDVSIKLGYAISVHKAQGSEYNNICYVLTDDQLSYFSLKNKKLHYTAITRAKKCVYIIN